MSLPDEEGHHRSGSVDSQSEGRARPLRDLPIGVRIGLLVVGWLVVILGLAGLFLPGLQGILMLIIGAAMLSAASDTAHGMLQKLFEKRPRIRARLDRFRDRLRHKLTRRRD